MENQKSAFDPSNHVTKLKGRDYLEVKWRIAWLRAEHPDAIVETDLVSHESGRAIMRARVTLPNGASATGWGSVIDNAFENYIEKAETKAFGRALAALGFGIQFTDMGDADDQDQSNHGPAQGRNRPNDNGNNYQGSNYLATPPQISRIKRLAGEQGLDEAALNDLIHQHTGATIGSLQKRQASGLIDLLESRRPATSPGPSPARNHREGTITQEQEREIRNLQARLGWSDKRMGDFIQQPVDSLPEHGASKLIHDLNRILVEGEAG